MHSGGQLVELSRPEHGPTGSGYRGAVGLSEHADPRRTLQGLARRLARFLLTMAGVVTT